VFDRLIDIKKSYEANETWSYEMPWTLPSFAPAGHYRVRMEISGYVTEPENADSEGTQVLDNESAQVVVFEKNRNIKQNGSNDF
jgi:hypothetical protein